MENLNSGSALACGHPQAISGHRTKIAKEGKEQPAVWCVQCNAWSRVVPETTEVPE